MDVLGGDCVQDQPQHHNEHQIKPYQELPFRKGTASCDNHYDQKSQHGQEKQGAKDLGQYGSEVFHNALFGFHQIHREHGDSTAAVDQQIVLYKGFQINGDRLKDEHREHDQDHQSEQEQTAVNHTFPCEAQEIHAGPARLPVPSHISEACNQPEQDRKMDGCQGFSVPWFIGGVEINDHQTEGKNPRKNPAQLSAAAMFDGEKQSDQGQNIEAEVLEIG